MTQQYSQTNALGKGLNARYCGAGFLVSLHLCGYTPLRAWCPMELWTPSVLVSTVSTAFRRPQQAVCDLLQAALSRCAGAAPPCFASVQPNDGEAVVFHLARDALRQPFFDFCHALSVVGHARGVGAPPSASIVGAVGFFLGRCSGAFLSEVFEDRFFVAAIPGVGVGAVLDAIAGLGH